MATNDPQAKWLAEFLRGKKIAEVFVDHDEHNGLIRITLDVTEGTVNLVATYGDHDEQDAVIDWEVILPTPIVHGPIRVERR